MKALNLFKVLMIVSLTVFLTSCEKDDRESNAAIKFESTYQTAKSMPLNGALAEEVFIEDFIINIEEIEIEFDDDDPMFESDSVYSDYEFDGPFLINLMEDGNPLEAFILNNVELPLAAYDEIEFEFDENETPGSEMYGKSILIRGTFDGTPFIFWSDEEVEVEVEFEEPVFIDDASNAILTVSFDLGTLFSPGVGGIDLGQATDGNGDGLIEIYSDDPDGNEDLADMISEKIKDIIEAFEEEYDD
jgi:hypothetical protein